MGFFSEILGRDLERGNLERDMQKPEIGAGGQEGKRMEGAPNKGTGGWGRFCKWGDSSFFSISPLHFCFSAIDFSLSYSHHQLPIPLFKQFYLLF